MPRGWRPVDQFTRSLALAVRLRDSVVGGRPLGDHQVRVAEADEQPIRNSSGYYLFFDLPQEEVTVAVDGGDQYRDATETVNLDPDATDTNDPGDAVVVSLDPTTAYPFPPGMTRVRGTLRDNDSPVSGATVSVENHSRAFETTEAGEFVYYFDDIDRDDIERPTPQTNNSNPNNPNAGNSNSNNPNANNPNSNNPNANNPNAGNSNSNNPNANNSGTTDSNDADTRLYRPDGSDPVFVADGSPGTVQRSVRVEVGTLTTADIEY